MKKIRLREAVAFKGEFDVKAILCMIPGTFKITPIFGTGIKVISKQNIIGQIKGVGKFYRYLQ